MTVGGFQVHVHDEKEKNPGDVKDKHVIIPYLANLFHVALSEKRILACWKKAKISPLYKKALSLIPTTTACWL